MLAKINGICGLVHLEVNVQRKTQLRQKGGGGGGGAQRVAVEREVRERRPRLMGSF